MITMDGDKSIAVLIPCYNEALTIGKVVNDFKTALPESTIYVYDNNSTDSTVENAIRAGAVVKKEIRQGKGNVVRSMFFNVDADVYVLVDGDDTYPAESVVELIAPIINGEADMVVGDRLSATYFTENKRPMHNSGNRMVRYIINRLFGSSVKDVMSGYRAFNRDFVKNFPIMSEGFEIETEMTIHALDKNFRIKEIPVKYRDRPENSESKLNTLGDGYRVLKMIAILFRDYKPFSFFSVIAILFAIVGCGLFVPVVCEYIQTGLVPRFPTLIVACVLFIVAILTFLVGIILGAIAKNNRRDYEYRHLNNIGR